MTGNNNLPTGWSDSPLGEVVEILDSSRIPVNQTERDNRPGDVPYYGATGLVGWIDDFIFDEELVLLGEDGAPFLDKAKSIAYMVRGKSWVNNHAHVLRGRNGILNQFIMHQLNASDFHPFVSGTTRLKLPQAPMRIIPLRICPTGEQERIVEAIEEQFTRLDAGVAALKRVEVNLRRYKAAVLKAAVEGRLLAGGMTRVGFRRSDWQTIETVIESIEQGWSPKCDREPSDDDRTWGVIKTTAVQPMYYSERENKRLPRSLEARSSLELKTDDLLITRAGPRSRCGICCLVKSTRPRLLACDKVYRIRVDERMARVGYVEIALNAPPILDSLEELKTGISDSGVNLTQGRFGRLRIPIPPLKVQEYVEDEVRRVLSIVQEAEFIFLHGLARASRLRQSILKRAFEGKLVPQDPTDEPASVLLDRIRAERAKSQAGMGSKHGRGTPRRRRSSAAVE